MIDLDQALRNLDPARDAAPPTAEPARYQRLQAAATGQDTHRSDPGPRRSLGSWRLGRRPRPAVFALVAACALAVIAVIAQGLLAPAPSATAAVNAAADRLAAATSGHIWAEWLNPEGQQIAVGDFAGANIQFTLSNRYPGQPAKDSDQQFIGIGTHLWVLRQGSWQLQPAEAGGQMYPFTQSSAAVIKALASGSTLTTSQHGPTSTTYRVVPDQQVVDALRRLRPGELSWFDLEHPEQVASATITVTDGIATAVDITFRPGWIHRSYSGRFSDFGKPVVITAPGPIPATRPTPMFSTAASR